MSSQTIRESALGTLLGSVTCQARFTGLRLLGVHLGMHVRANGQAIALYSTNIGYIPGSEQSSLRGKPEVSASDSMCVGQEAPLAGTVSPNITDHLARCEG